MRCVGWSVDAIVLVAARARKTWARGIFIYIQLVFRRASTAPTSAWPDAAAPERRPRPKSGSVKPVAAPIPTAADPGRDRRARRRVSRAPIPIAAVARPGHPTVRPRPAGHDAGDSALRVPGCLANAPVLGRPAAVPGWSRRRDAVAGPAASDSVERPSHARCDSAQRSVTGKKRFRNLRWELALNTVC